MSPLIEGRGLVRQLGAETAVDGIDLDVSSGEVHAIVGLNGAGKTTLMRLLLGMLRPERGRALVLGADAASAGATTWSQVGHLIESPFTYPELTTRENLAAAALVRSAPADEIDHLVGQTIAMFELEHWADRRVTKLSQGNRQRLGLATAFVHRPRLLVLDEPANALDPAGVVFVRDLLRATADANGGVLVSSHHLDQLARVADTISVLHRGRVVGSIDPGQRDLEERFFDLVYDADQKART